MAHQSKDDPLGAVAGKMFATAFAATLKLAPDDGPPFWVDGRRSPPAISNEAPANGDADCLWRGKRDALIRAMAGTRAFESAYASGRVAVSGDMSVMARIILGDGK